MAVSRERTHWYFRGDLDKCRDAMPFCLHMAHLNDVVMAYGKVEVWTRHFAIPGDGQGVVHTFNGERYIYIDMPPHAGNYIEVTEEYAGLDFLYDPLVCFREKDNKEIECTYDNKCFGSIRNGSCIVKRAFKKRSVTKQDDYGEEEFYTTDIEGNKTYVNLEDYAQLGVNTICPPGDATWHHCLKMWSKTVDEYTATCFMWYDHWFEVNMWAVVVDRHGEYLPFRAGKLTYDWWPYPGAFDVVQVGGVDSYNVTPVYKAFDLWKEEKKVKGKTEIKYYLSVLADPSQRIDVWCLNYSDKTMRLETISISWINDFIERYKLYYPYQNDGWEVRHIRVIGLVKRTGYWAVLDCHYGVASGQMQIEEALNAVYWENDKQKGRTSVGAAEASPCGFQMAILNEWTEEIEVVDAISCQKCEPIEGSIIYDLGYYSYAVNCYTWDCASDVSDCGGPGSGDGTITVYNSGTCPWVYGDVELEVPFLHGYCNTYPKCGYVNYGHPGAYMFCDGTDPINNMPALGAYSTQVSYIEIVDYGTDCSQSGLQKGSLVSRYGNGHSYICSQGSAVAILPPSSDCGNAWRCHCGGDCDPCGRCSPGDHSGYVNGYCFRYTYNNYGDGSVNGACVLKTGIYGWYHFSETTGIVSICDKGTTDTTKVTEHDYDFPNGRAIDFEQSNWPYYPSYAIVKDAYSCKDMISRKVDVKSIATQQIIESTEFIDKDKEEKCHIKLDKWAVLDNDRKIHSEEDIILGEASAFFYQASAKRRRYQYNE